MHQPPPALIQMTRHQPVIFWTRRHPAPFLGRGAMIAGSLILPGLWLPFVIPWLPWWMLVILLIIYYGTVAFIATVEWLTFSRDYFVITPTAIFDINQEALFARRISELSLKDILDVHVEVKGLWQHFFHYGNLRIETAGATENPLIKDLPQPHQVAAKITASLQKNPPRTDRQAGHRINPPIHRP